jgi:hypothetical protein
MLSAPAQLSIDEMVKNPSEAWARFKVDFDKHYLSPEEEAFRFDVFEKYLKMILEYNNNANKSILGVNEFADWTPSETDRLFGLPVEDYD